MQNKILLFAFEFILFFNKYNFISALLGSDVRPIELNEFPAVVCLFHNIPQNTWAQNIMCTGTLFTPSTVITSEQCFSLVGNTGFIINAGSRNILQSHNYYPIWWVSFDIWASFVGVETGNRINDIGVIRVNQGILEAQIPSISLNPITPITSHFGNFVEIVGCGKTAGNAVPAVKQTVAAFIITHQECEIRTSLIREQWLAMPTHCLCSLCYPSAFITDGDVGGPLILDNTLVGINVGASPYLNGTYHPDKVNVHITIDLYRHFLEHIRNM